MKATATISSTGQLTLPKAVKDRLGLSKGDVVEFTLDERGIHLRPVRGDANPFPA
jgi:AbrB family looped-hinge helix DNA binding protein